MAPRLRIEDHGLIGDGRSAALVAADGTIDWLCWPRFDSAPTFAALLDDPSRGAFELRPMGAGWRSHQRYEDDTAVLHTTFRREGGWVRLVDFMPVDRHREGGWLAPEHELVRVVECLEGGAEIEACIRPSPRFGAVNVRRLDRGRFGLCAETRQGAFFLRCERPLRWHDDGARACFRISAGEQVRFSMSWSPEAPAVLAPLGPLTDEARARTERYWRGWVRTARYAGPYEEAVRRSALVLKLLQYPPSGALLAAATTSLPERLGADLNWDYRYCWLRDAAFTARCLYDLEFDDEANAFVFWLMHTTGLTQPRLSVLYDVFGNSPGRERELWDLRGYEGSRPVRIGNGAEHQLQLDLQGEILDAVCASLDHDGELDGESRRMLTEFGEYIASSWHLPDASLWEDRGEPRHYTHSKVLCWVALDRLVKLHQQGELPKLDADCMCRERDRLRTVIHARAVSSRTGAYMRAFDLDEPDTALLLLSWYGFTEPGSPAMRATLREVVRRLDAGDGLLFRNPALKAEGDGAFVVASFWAIQLVAAGAGTLAQAERWFEKLLEYSGPLGLYAEEVEPRTGRALGNFPQAYSHVGLIGAALAIEQARWRLRRGGEVRTGQEAAP